MATAKHRLEYEVRLKDMASRGLKKLGKNAKKETQKASEGFKGLRKAIKLAGLAVVAAFAAGVFQGLRKGIERVREFSKAMGEVSTILGEGGVAIGAASEKVRELAASLGVPAPEVAAGMYQTLSAGVTDSAQAMTMLEGATKLGIAGLSTTKEAVDLLTTAFNAYGMEVTESGVAAMNDMIFKTVQLGKTTIPELSASMGQVLPMAAQMGVSIKEVSAAVATLTLSGVNTSEAITQVTAVMTAFLNQGDKYGDLMGSAAFASKTFQEAITDLMDSVDGNADSLKKMMGRAEGVKAVMALTANDGKVLTEQLVKLGEANGIVDEGFAKMSETMDRKLKAAQEIITQGFADIAAEMLKFQLGAATFEDVTDGAESFKDAIAGLTPILSAMGLFLGAMVTAFLTAFTAIQGAILGVAKAMEVLDLVSEETVHGMEDSFMGSMTALAGAADMTQNFGRALVGLESNGLAATQAVAGMSAHIKEARDGSLALNNAANLQAKELSRQRRAVEKGFLSEEKALKKINQAIEYYTDEAKFLGVELPKQVEAWKVIAERGTLFAEVAGDAKDKVEGLSVAVDSLAVATGAFFSEEFLAAFSKHTAMMQHDYEILMMTIEDGEEKQILALEHRAEMEERAMQERIFNMGLEQDAAFALDRPWFEARREQLKKEIEDLKAANQEKKREAEKAARDSALAQKRAWESLSPALQAVILNPVRGAMLLGVRLAAEGGAAMAASMKEAVKGKLGTELAGELGGALGVVGGFFELTPTFNLANLEANLAEAEEQIAAHLAGGVISEEQGQDMLDMIENVKEFTLEEMKAAAAVYEFKRSLEGLSEVEAGVAEGLRKFVDEMPELGEQIADITHKGLKAFGEGLTDALMSFADGSKSAKEAFADFARSFVVQMARMIIQMAIMRALAAAIPGFGAFMGIAGYASGGVVEGGVEPLASGGIAMGGLGRALPVRGYAGGGPIVSEPHVALIGEGSMNEAVVPLPDGRSIPVDLGGGGGAEINISIEAVDARGIDELLVSRQETLRSIISQAMTESRVFRNAMRA